MGVENREKQAHARAHELRRKKDTATVTRQQSATVVSRDARTSQKAAVSSSLLQRFSDPALFAKNVVD